MRFELFVALRYLLAPRKQAFISVISLISVVGVAVGVAAVVIALALMTGLQGELRDRILGSQSHIYVYKNDGGFERYEDDVRKLREVPGVVGAAPAILGRALVSTNRAVEFVSLKGIDPALEPTVTDIKSSMRSGAVTDLAPRSETDRSGILLGKDLAAKLGVEVGDTVTLLTEQGTLSPMGVVPRSRLVRVAGIYSLGLLEYDSAFGFVSIDFAKNLLSKDSPDFVQLKVSDIYQAPAIAEGLPKRLGSNYAARDWADLNQPLFSALWLEKMAISITIGLIIAVGALNIISSLVLLVMEKSRDIAILKTMGTSSGRVMLIFMLQGSIIGLVGTTIGGTLGLALCWASDRYRLIQIPIDVYQISYVPFVVRPQDFAIVILSALLICFLSTLYPSRQASKLDPIQALRFE
jgi:lipoprotein-releasing system permease protein